MEQIISSADARRRLPAMLRALRQGHAPARFVIGRHRRPEAVLLSVGEYEDLVRRAGRADTDRDPEALLRANRAEVLRIAARYGAHDVRVFGSVVRGEAGPESDIDLLVRLEPERTLLDLGGLYAELEELLGRVDVVPEEGLKPEVRERVLAEAVPL